MKNTKIHKTLVAAVAALTVACVCLATELAASKKEAEQFMAVGVYAVINGKKEVLTAIHDPSAKDIRLPGVNREAMERVLALAVNQSAAPN